MAYKPGDDYVGLFLVIDDTTDELTAADSLPTAVMVHNGVEDEAVSLTVAAVSTGQYKVTGTIPGSYDESDVVHVVATVVLAGVTTQAIVSEFVFTTTISTATPIDLQPVLPANTTIVISKAGVGNVGERTIPLTIGEAQLMAIDFRKLMPTNGRILTATVENLSGVTLGIGTVGVDRSQVKFLVTPSLAGESTVECVVTFADGGGQKAASVKYLGV